MDFIETSAKTNMNIQEAFTRLATEICEVKSQQTPATLPYDPNPSMSLPRNTSLLEKKSSSSSSGSTCAC